MVIYMINRLTFMLYIYILQIKKKISNTNIIETIILFNLEKYFYISENLQNIYTFFLLQNIIPLNFKAAEVVNNIF